jgi:hypothetical protein
MRVFADGSTMIASSDLGLTGSREKVNKNEEPRALATLAKRRLTKKLVKGWLICEFEAH